MIGGYFNDDKSLQKQREEQKRLQQELKANLNHVVSVLNLVEQDLTLPENFYLLENLAGVYIYESYQCADSSVPFQCFVLSYHTAVRAGRVSSSGNDLYFFGVVQLEKEYPQTLIHPETVAEKIAEIFVKREVDFPNSKKFSRTFYTVTTDKETLKYLFYDKMLDELAPWSGMEMELKGRYCLFRHSRMPVSEKEAITFASLAQAVLRVFC